MKILFHIPRYSDSQLSGGEKTAQDYAEALKSLGWGVRILTVQRSQTELNSIPIHLEDEGIKRLYRWADIVFSHLTFVGNAVNWCKMFNKPLISYAHNTNFNPLDRRADLLLFNSNWVREESEERGFKGVVCRPLLNTDFEVTEGKYITLININENKGGHILRQIAEQMPKKKFMGVIGGYGEQVTLQPSNVKIVPNQDIKNVLKQTKLLIMPSKYESYGRTAVEALLSGIPVIATESGKGLQEAIQSGGLFIPKRDNISDWVLTINKVLDNYNHFRQLALNERARIKEDAKHDLDTFVSLAKSLILEYENSTIKRSR